MQQRGDALLAHAPRTRRIIERLYTRTLATKQTRRAKTRHVFFRATFSSIVHTRPRRHNGSYCKTSTAKSEVERLRSPVRLFSILIIVRRHWYSNEIVTILPVCRGLAMIPTRSTAHVMRITHRAVYKRYEINNFYNPTHVVNFSEYAWRGRHVHRPLLSRLDDALGSITLFVVDF